MQIPGAPPGCPAPDMGVSREVVAVWVASHILLKIVASDTHHALVVAKSLQQFITEAEKRCCRQTVILKNDPLFLPFEKPRDCAADGVAAAEIAVAKKGADVHTASRRPWQSAEPVRSAPTRPVVRAAGRPPPRRAAAAAPPGLLRTLPRSYPAG